MAFLTSRNMNKHAFLAVGVIVWPGIMLKSTGVLSMFPSFVKPYDYTPRCYLKDPHNIVLHPKM